jgi:signal transduction histidine kinase
MLRRLRKQMVLLNAVISGAILLAMAVVALYISEQMVSKQYELDLSRNASDMLATVQNESGAVRVQFASGYVVIIRVGGREQVLSTMENNGTDFQPIVEKALFTLKTDIKPDIDTDAAVLASGKNLAIVQRFFTKPEQSGQGEAADNAFFFKMRTLYSLGNILVDSNGASYRVSATIADGDPDVQLYVIQNRSDEIASIVRLRWLFFGCAMGGLLLIFCASQFLSGRSIRPVEKSIAQQREFVAAASHELRTPVAAVRANAEVLHDAPLGDFEPYLTAITQESIRMSHLISDMLDLARADAGELQVREETVDAKETVRRTVAILTPLAAEREILMETELKPAFCKADSDRLCQVLVVLLDNAIRYSPKGERIRITTESAGQHVLIRVADHGPGIPDEHKGRIFDRFYRMDSARSKDGGCGLGLSIAKQLSEQMHGALRLSDTDGGGCTFELKLRSA